MFRSFFSRQAGGEFEFEDWDSLWSLLALITLRKCGNRIEYYRAARRDLQRDAQLNNGIGASHDSRTAWEAVAGEPTASQAGGNNRRTYAGARLA